MPPLLVLDDVLRPSYSVFRAMQAPQLQAPLSGGATQTRRLWPRPLTRFRLRAPMESFKTSTALWAFMTYHQSDIPFRFSGLQYGDYTTTPLFVTFGDGQTRDVLLPNRNVSLTTVYVGTKASLGQVVPLVEVNAAAGTVRLSTPPALNTYIRTSYRCWYRCIFQGSDEALVEEEWYYPQESRFEEITLQEIPY